MVNNDLKSAKEIKKKMLFSTSYNQNLRQATQLLQPSTPFNSFYYIPDITKPNEKCFFTKDTKIQPNMVLYASSDILPKRNKDVAYFLPDGTDIGDVPILNPRTELTNQKNKVEFIFQKIHQLFRTILLIFQASVSD